MSAGKKMSAEAQKLIVQYLRAGNFVNVAVVAAGVSRQTFYAWIRRGKEEPDSDYGKFAAEVKQASAAAEARATAVVMAAASTHWQAAAWFLERKHPRRWAKRPEAPKNNPSVHQEAPSLAKFFKAPEEKPS